MKPEDLVEDYIQQIQTETVQPEANTNQVLKRLQKCPALSLP